MLKGLPRNRVAPGARLGEDHAGSNPMRRPLGYMLTAVLALGLAGSSLVAHAQSSGASGDATREPSGPVRTGKERLGNKWSDEQRVDNCKVPPDKRGAKVRPDSCAEAVTH
jgi:hypothetical protein